MAVDVGAVRERVAALRAGLPAPDVRVAREVVVVASSSRGGSSIFAEVLRRSRALLHFRAEVNPQLRLYGCEGGDDDALAPGHPVPPGLGTALGADCGQPTDRLDDDEAITTFAREIAARLVLQWPDLDVAAPEVADDVRRVLAERWAAAWAPGHFADASDFYVRLLARFAARWPAFHPAAYDVDRERVAGTGPAGAYCPGRLVEEPPFVLPLPWRHPTEAELRARPLVIKTPSNAYRLGWLRRLFPDARVRVLHLVRNPAASINGLSDGWRFPVFHSHDVGGLAIQGYSDVVAGGDRWWKFDRPPGWRALTSAPLERVCAAQWSGAHAAVLRDGDGDRHCLRFEDVVGARHRQERAMGELADWLGLPVHDELAAVLHRGLPAVMATHQPRHRRWFARAGLLEPVLALPEVQSVREALGYPEDRSAWE